MKTPSDNCYNPAKVSRHSESLSVSSSLMVEATLGTSLDRLHHKDARLNLSPMVTDIFASQGVSGDQSLGEASQLATSNSLRSSVGEVFTPPVTGMSSKGEVDSEDIL